MNEIFNGKGVVNFGQNKDAYVEWYQENDGDAGMADLTIRYSGIAKGRIGRPLKLTANGQIVHEKLMLPNSKD